MHISLREQYAMIDEYGGVDIDSIRPTEVECKAAFDTTAKEQNPNPTPSYPLTADDWIKQGAMGLVRIHLEVIEGGDFYQNMMKQPSPVA